jgi:hypothetical protein
MDSTLEYILLNVHGFLLLHPFVLGAQDHCFPGSSREAGGAERW